MAAFTKRDQQLLSEAYSTQLLKESFHKMTISQVSNNLDLLSESEEEYVCLVSERILNEFFGGLKNVFGGAKQTAGGATSAVQGAGSRIAQGASNLANKAGGAIKSAGQGIAQAGRQVGSNVKDMYNTGVEAEKSQQFVGKAQQYVDALKAELDKAQQSGLITFKGPVDQMPLGEIVDELLVASKGNQSFANSAKRNGVLGGAGKAFKQGYNQ